MAKFDYEPQPPVTADETFPAKDIRIRQAADIINSAKKPFLYFGGGLITSEAQDELLQMAVVKTGSLRHIYKYCMG